MVHQRNTKLNKNGYHQNIIHRASQQNLNGIKNEEKSFIHPRSVHGKEEIFPKYSPWIICLILLIVRLKYVSQPKNWWILHPDEIFQSLEVAHSEVYGYGFRPYEYLPPKLQIEPKGRKQEINFGMFSLRSFLFPQIFILVSKVSHLLIGDSIHPFLIWKMVHSAVSSCLPMTVYLFTVTVYKSHDSGVISSILVASSVHLSVFATHTLLSSFLSPLVFFTLPFIWRIFEPDSGCDQLKPESENEETENVEENTDVSTHGRYVMVHQNVFSVNGNHRKNPCMKLFGSQKHDIKREREEINSVLKTRPQKRFCHSLFVCGFFIGVLVYVRLDLLVFYASLFLPILIVHRKNIFSLLQKIMIIISGFCLGLFVGGTDDYNGYNYFFISPYQWFMFNVFKDFSTTFFGRSNVSFYISHVLLHNFSMVALFCCLCLTLVTSVVKRKAFYQPRRKETLCLLLSTATIFISYTLKGHKEPRFLHNFIVLLMVIYSNTLVVIWHNLQTRFCLLKSKTTTTLIAVLMLTLFTGHQWYVFPDVESYSEWSYLNNQHSGHANECLYYISQQKDVSGVFFDQSLHTSGAYTILHLDVPLLTLIQKEFLEFSHESRLHIQPLHRWLRSKNSSDSPLKVNALCNISNYVSIYNMQYLLKHLITRSEYNYILIKKTRQFIPIGFKQVFESGSMKVLKRIGDPDSERNLASLAKKVSVLSSFTSEKMAGDVLLHEAHYLYSFGQYKLAEERLSFATHLKSPRAEVYQLLFNLNKEQGDEDKAEFYWRKCVKNFSQSTCLKSVEIVDLYELSKKW